MKPRTLRTRRTITSLVVSLIVLLFGVFLTSSDVESPTITDEQADVLARSDEPIQLAVDVIQQLEVKGRAPKTGYERSNFSDGWARVGNCDVRNLMLQRDLEDIELASDDCTVLSGTLQGPYSGQELPFVRGTDTSDDVQIDHVVSLSDAWQKGAQNLSEDERFDFANDPLNLLAVDGGFNQQKGDSDAASWLPPNKAYRCRFIARQIAVKAIYRLWVTEAEKAAMERILSSCPDQPLPIVNEP